MSRRILVVAALLVVGVAASAAVALTPRGPSGTVALLETRVALHDRLPASIRNSHFSAAFAHPLRARYAGRSLSGFRFYVIAGKENYLCLVGTKGSGVFAETYGVCNGREVLKSSAIWIARGPDGRGRFEVAALVSDGYSALAGASSRAAVRNNVAFIRVPDGALSLRLSGANRQALTVPIG